MTPLTSSEKQARRVTELDAIAQAAGWATWTRYATAVKRGVVSIAANPAAQLRGAVVIESRSGDRPQSKNLGSGESKMNGLQSLANEVVKSNKAKVRRNAAAEWEAAKPSQHTCDHPGCWNKASKKRRDGYEIHFFCKNH